MERETLPGRAGGAERVGRRVRRPAGPWTPAVHEFLLFLSEQGLRGIPQVHGVEVQGVDTDGEWEMLSYVPGRGVPTDEVVLDDVLVEAVAWLRDFHDIAEAFRPVGPRRWRQAEAELDPRLDPGQIICHNDPGTYNWIIEGGHFAAMIDWDMAGPGQRIDDLAFLAWTALPLDRAADEDEVLRRLDLLVDAYGEYGPRTVLDAVAARMDTACDRIAAGQERGDPAMINLGRSGEPARTRGLVKAFLERKTRWESLL